MAANGTAQHFELLFRASAPQFGQLYNGKYLNILFAQLLALSFFPWVTFILSHPPHTHPQFLRFMMSYFMPHFQIVFLDWSMSLKQHQYLPMRAREES